MQITMPPFIRKLNLVGNHVIEILHNQNGHLDHETKAKPKGNCPFFHFEQKPFKGMHFEKLSFPMLETCHVTYLCNFVEIQFDLM